MPAAEVVQSHQLCPELLAERHVPSGVARGQRHRSLDFHSTAHKAGTGLLRTLCFCIGHHAAWAAHYFDYAAGLADARADCGSESARDAEQPLMERAGYNVAVDEMMGQIG